MFESRSNASENYRLEEELYNEIAKQKLLTLFNTEEPSAFLSPYREEISERAILSPYMWEPKKELSDALKNTINEFGDSDFFVSVIGHTQKRSPDYHYHWRPPLDLIDRFTRFIGPVENVVYSPRGVWGIVCGDETHALLASTGGFIDKLRAQIPHLDDQVFDFLDHWKKIVARFNSNFDWLPQLLTKIYGRDRAVELLILSGFTKLDNI